MENKNVAIIIALAVIVIAGGFYFGFFSLFQPTTEKVLTQYLIDEADRGNADLWFKAQMRGQTFTTCTTGCGNYGGTDDGFRDSIFSNTVEINSGKNIFKFVAEKAGRYQTFGLSAYDNNPYGYGCYQRVQVYKNNILVDTIKSWGNDLDAQATRFAWNGKTWQYYDDATQKSYVQFTMNDMGEDNGNAKFFGNCRWWFNYYKLIISNDSVNINVTTNSQTLISGQNLSADVRIDNKLNQIINGDLTLTLQIPSAFGTVTKDNTKTVLLNPGINNINFQVPLESKPDSLTISTNLRAGLSGNNFIGLNFERANLIFLDCFNTDSQGRCQESNVERDGGMLRKVNTGDFVVIGDINGIAQQSGSCKTEADINCDNIIAFSELNSYAQQWVSGVKSWSQLLSAAQVWATT